MASHSKAASIALLAGVLALGLFPSHAETGVPFTDLGFNLTGDPQASQFSLDYKVVLIPEKEYRAAGGDDSVFPYENVNALLLQQHLAELSTPSVTTQEGLKATVEVMRDFSYAFKFDRNKNGQLDPSDFKTQRLGYHITCLPTFTADKKAAYVDVECEIISFNGWIAYPEGKQPLFHTRRVKTQCLLSFDKPAIVWFQVPVPKGPFSKDDPNASLVREGLMITIHPPSLATR